MRTITFILPEDGLFSSLLPSSHQKRQLPAMIKISHNRDVPLAVRMWFSLLGGNVNYSPFVTPRHLEPGYTYILRDNSDGLNFVRYRPGPRRRYIDDGYDDEDDYDSRPRRPRYDHYSDSSRNDGLKDFGPPDMPSQALDYHHHRSSSSHGHQESYYSDNKYHDLERKLQSLRARLSDRHTLTLPTPAHPSPSRTRSKSPDSDSSSSSSSSKASSKHSHHSSSAKEQPKSSDSTRKVRFADVEDYVEDMYDRAFPSSRTARDPGSNHGHANGGGSSRWSNEACYDESHGGYGIIREPRW